MTDELINEQAITQESSNVLEAQALNELKKRNDALQAQNADLMAAKKMYYDSVINGQLPEESAPKERTVKEIRDELVGKVEKGCTNLEYMTLAMELDDACIREEGQSCFLPKGKDVTVTADEVMLSEKFPRIIKECIETADGDPVIFDNELKRHMKKR